MPERVAITGATGYLGSALSAMFLSAGWSVLALSRHKPSLPGITWHHWSLGTPLAPEVLVDTKYVIHCAYDRQPPSSPASWQVNVEGSRQLFAQLSTTNRLILISSIAAQPNLKQRYGSHKYAIEQLALAHGGMAIRPGLIIGTPLGGILANLANLSTVPILPLPAATAVQYLTSMDALCNHIWSIVNAPTWSPQSTTIVTQGPISMQALLRQLRPSIPVIIPVPWRPVWLLLVILETMGFKPPLSADSLYGLATTQYSPSLPLSPSD